MRDFFKTFDSFNKMLETIEKDFNPWFVGFDNADDEKEDASDVFEVRISDDNGKKEYYFRHNDDERSFNNSSELFTALKELGTGKSEDETEEENEEVFKDVADDDETEEFDDDCYGVMSGDKDEEELGDGCCGLCEFKSSPETIVEKNLPYYTSDVFVMFTDNYFPCVDEIVYSNMFSNNNGELCLQLTIEPHGKSLYFDEFSAGKHHKDCPIYFNYSSDDKNKFVGSTPLTNGFYVKDYEWANPIIDDGYFGPDRKDKNNVLVPFRFRTTLVLD